MRRCGAFVSLIVVLGSSYAWPAVPEPAVVQKPGQWTLQTVFEHPEQIMVRLPGEKRPSRFWYLIITVTNKSDSTVGFYPRCELMTDTFDMIPANKDVRNVVFEKIKFRYKGRYPFLESLEFVDNKILQGEDHTKDIVIIWPDFDSRARSVKLFVAGLSNETIAIDHPVARDENGSILKVYLRKTLELEYAIGGDPKFRKQAKMKLKDKKWIFR
ncbi:MAG: hypothetical protein ABIG61_08760 [Planctomycetota bacterium]